MAQGEINDSSNHLYSFLFINDATTSIRFVIPGLPCTAWCSGLDPESGLYLHSRWNLPHT
jgi:hypothetical protein